MGLPIKHTLSVPRTRAGSTVGERVVQYPIVAAQVVAEGFEA
jgi:hypothetical protein